MRSERRAERMVKALFTKCSRQMIKKFEQMPASPIEGQSSSPRGNSLSGGFLKGLQNLVSKKAATKKDFCCICFTKPGMFISHVFHCLPDLLVCHFNNYFHYFWHENKLNAFMGVSSFFPVSPGVPQITSQLLCLPLVDGWFLVK